MKLFVRILQIALALWSMLGGGYLMSNYASVASFWAYNTFPSAFWVGLAIVEILLGVGLLISSGNGALRKYTTPTAVGLAIIALSGSVLFAAYSGFPGILWALIPTALFLFVAYSRKGV